MNLLVLSVGIRCKLIEYLMSSKYSGDSVIAADASKDAPALYFADDYVIVPRITEENYIRDLLNICSEFEITHVLSLIDPELLLLSENKDIFDKQDINIIISPLEEVRITNDKYQFCKFLKSKSLPFVPTYQNFQEVERALDQGLVEYPLFYKPVDGSASQNIGLIQSKDELIRFSESEQYIFQKYMDGEEIGVDLYIDIYSKKIVSFYAKKKLRMRAGETEKSEAYYSKKLEETILKLVDEMTLVGPIDIDVFKVNGEYYISEINPRFGGGYLHAHEVGFLHTNMLFNNIHGKTNKEYHINKDDQTKCYKYSETLILGGE